MANESVRQVTDSAATTGQGNESPLLDVARLFAVCRDYYNAMFLDGLTEPKPGSVAEEDLKAPQAQPNGKLWPMKALDRPLATAANMVRQQCDFLAALAVLFFVEPKSQDPIYTLLRGSFEFGARAFWILAPDANSEETAGEPEVTKHRVRCARVTLTDLVSQTEVTKALKVATPSPETDTRIAESKSEFQKLKCLAIERFGDDRVLLSDAKNWSIGGEHYAMWTELAEFFFTHSKIPIDGAAMYALLSLRTHPQGFNATAGLYPLPDGTITRKTGFTVMRSVARTITTVFYVTLDVLADYYGYKSDLMTDLENDIEVAFPGFFGAERNTP